MPWVSEELCTGCGICITECCVDAISMEDDTAVIDEEECIRCGVCHDVCPTEAVRHDRERIPQEVASNMAWVEELLHHEYYSTDRLEQKHLIERLLRHFAKDRDVAEKTVEQLQVLRSTEYSD